MEYKINTRTSSIESNVNDIETTTIIVKDDNNQYEFADLAIIENDKVEQFMVELEKLLNRYGALK